MTAKSTLAGAALAMFFVLALCPVQALADQMPEGQDWAAVKERIGAKGIIDWTGGYMEAVGTGTPPARYYGKPQAWPMALRAAQLDAFRNLLEAAQGVRIDSETTVLNFATQMDSIKAQVEGMVKGAQIVKREYLSDGTVEVTLRMPIKGGFTQLMLPTEVRQIPQIRVERPSAPPAQPLAQAEPNQLLPEPEEVTAPVVYTGLVVDARGLAARPAMAPRVLDEDGREVYGAAFVSREFAVQQGMAGYSRNVALAQENMRVAAFPLTVKGIRTEGEGRADIVIPRSAANRLRASSENLAFLKNCRVMIVLD
ncbi:MAG: LPP20 family lipoprotein [Desulfatibacillaceae bacterium]|nr:LPP20 family lipoprotein [Desulfatibacillaceae bacterium]